MPTHLEPWRRKWIIKLGFRRKHVHKVVKHCLAWLGNKTDQKCEKQPHHCSFELLSFSLPIWPLWKGQHLLYLLSICMLVKIKSCVSGSQGFLSVHHSCEQLGWFLVGGTSGQGWAIRDSFQELEASCTRHLSRLEWEPAMVGSVPAHFPYRSVGIISKCPLA